MVKKNNKKLIVQINWWKLGISLSGFIIGMIIFLIIMW